MPALLPTDFSAKITWLGRVADREASLRSERLTQVHATYAGVEGEEHGGLTRASCSRVISQYPKGTDIRNVRQFSILSAEELADIAAEIGVMHLNDEIDAIIWCAARNTFILPEDKRVPEIKATLKWEFVRSMKLLGERIGDNEFLMGDKMTVPDILLTHCGGWARMAGFKIPDGPLKAYFKRMITRPAYLRAYALRKDK